VTAPLWSADDLGKATRADAAFAATGVSIDSRTVQPGDLFVALVGETGDGHAHVADALAKGAAGALVHQLPGRDIDRGRLIRLNEGTTLDALAGLGAFARQRFTGRVVAVTGSVGKTTTKEMLRAVLSVAGQTHAAVASYNNHWGVPLTLARMPPGAAFAVIEIGMNHAGEILPLTRLAKPHVAVITAIASTHLGHLGSVEAIADEKASILDGLVPGGIAVLPADSPYLPRLRARVGGASELLFGTARGAFARLLETASGPETNDVTAQIGELRVTFRMQAPGAHMAANAAATLAAAAGLGLDPLAAAASLAGFAPVGGRGARRRIARPGGEILLLDESYNASPASVRAALSVLALQSAQRRVAVLGDMLELGDAGPDEHAGLAGEVASAADLLFTCGPLMRGLHESVPGRMRGTHAATSAELAPEVLAALRPGDAVLVKGSLGSRMKLIVQAIDAPAAAGHAGGAHAPAGSR
jgi:UDP-N-acetylmuramoyl-tripeptide--D-alanyl-D-alanine ligase